jgi:hypothetical protein
MADERSDEPVVLGAELAAARAAQRRHVPAGPSPLAGVAYPPGSGELWRWVERDEDATVAEFLRSYAAAGGPARVAARSSLDMDDLYTLLLFARRRALAALRTGDAGAVGDAFDALSAIDVERVDWRDAAVVAVLATFAAQHVGDPSELAGAAVSRAADDMAEMLAEIAGSAPVELAEDAGYRLVDTGSGPVLLEDDLEDYEPGRDLIPLALELARRVEAEGSYEVDSVEVATEVAGIWVGADADDAVAQALVGVSGCVSLHAHPGAGDRALRHFLLGYLAEAATAQDAATIAAGTARGGRAGAEVTGVAVDRWFAVLVAACTVAGEPSVEDAASLARFLPLLEATLR